MKKIILTLFALIIMFLTAGTCYSQYQDLGAGSGTTKLLLHLNGNSNDLSGNSNNGTDSIIDYGLAYGKFNQGASFNGSSSKIKFADSSSLKPNKLTVGAWIYKTDLTVSPFSHIFQSWSLNPSNAGFKISQNNETGQMFFSIGNNSTSNVLTTNTLIKAGTWYHIMATYDSATLKIYINGNLDNQMTKTVELVYGTSNFVNIGCRQRTSTTIDRFWYGYIDEVILYNRAWTSSEIKRYYTNSKSWFFGLNNEQKHDLKYLDWFIPKQMAA